MRAVRHAQPVELGPHRSLRAVRGFDQRLVDVVDALRAVRDGLRRRDVGLFPENDQESVLRESGMPLRRISGGRAGQGEDGERRGSRKAQSGGLLFRNAVRDDPDGGEEDAEQE